MASPSLRTFTVTALALFGISCSSSESSGGNGGSGPATGGSFGGATTTGGVVGSGGITSSGTGGNGSGGKAGSGAGGSANGGSNGGGKGGSGSGGAVNGGSGSGGTSSGGATGASSGGSGSGGSANGGSGSGGSGSGSSGSGGATNGGSGSGGTTGTSGTGGSTSSGTSVGSTGCGKTSTLKFGSVPNESASASASSGNGVGFGTGGYLTIQSGGQSRGFAVRLPDNYNPSTPYWLIFGFHWNGGNSSQVDNGGTSGYDWAYYGLQKQSKNGAIFVAPDGLSAGWANTGGRDLTFTDDMVKLIEDNYCVDTTHIISTGFSYGGGMSYEIACARAKVFRAVAIFEGAQLSGCDGGNDPIAFWQMVGTADTTCSESMATPLRDKFVKNNACTAQNPPQPANGSLTHTCTSYDGCSTGHPLRWCVHGAGHTPAPVDGSSSLYGPGGSSWVPQDLWPWLTAL
jgi:poly(3-hydroxybutyrate) depolymerase